MTTLVVLPIVLPLFTAGVSLVLHGRLLARRILSIATVVVSLASAAVLLHGSNAEGPVVVDVGGWPAPIGITLVADVFATFLLTASMAAVLAVLAYAVASPATEDERAFFHPVYLVLTAGVSAAFLTGDLFNLFVAFEMMLIASYVLITLGASRDQVRSGMTYVVISLLASTLFITAVALIYAATGTVNLADLAGKLDAVPPTVRQGLGVLLLLVFGIKAALFPLFFWLPDSYPTAPTPITAIFAGLLTKVGVYAIIRTQTLLFPTDGVPSDPLLWIAAATMVVGVLGAVAQDDVKRILSFHIVSQIGYMVFGLALFTAAGIAAAVLFVANQIIVKTTLFLVGGLIEQSTGTGALRRLGGMVHRTPAIAALFAVPALSLAGIPPFSGFVPKLALVEAGLSIGEGGIVAVSLVVSVFTLFSMTKIWTGVFWGQPDEPADAGEVVPVRTRSLPAPMLAATGALVGLTIAISLAAGPLYTLSESAGRSLIERRPYVEAVLGR